MSSEKNGCLEQSRERSWLKNIFVPALFLVLSLYLLYGVFRPFLKPLFWASVLATLLYPAYDLLRTRTSRDAVAAGIMLFLVTCLLIIPLTILVHALVDELIATVSYLERSLPRLREVNIEQVPIVSAIWAKLQPYVNLDPDALRTALIDRARILSAEAAKHASWIFLDLVSVSFQSAIMLVSLYFFFKDGHVIIAGISGLTPIPDHDRRRLLQTLDGTITATLHGGLSVAIVQGIVGGVTFWLLGLRAPILWGTAMAFLAFVPIIGASLVWIPAALYLLVTGQVAKGVLLIVVGALIISMVDYVLRPIIIGNRTRQHTLLILLSVLGGIQFFGPVGLVAGPMVVAFFLAMIAFYRTTEEDGDSPAPPSSPSKNA